MNGDNEAAPNTDPAEVSDPAPAAPAPAAEPAPAAAIAATAANGINSEHSGPSDTIATGPANTDEPVSAQADVMPEPLVTAQTADEMPVEAPVAGTADSPVEAVAEMPAEKQATEEPASEQAAAEEAPVVVKPAPVAAVSLDDAGREAGLQLIETAPSNEARPAVPPSPVAPRPRRVRRKAPAAPPAPLQQVETGGPTPSA